MSTGSHNRTVLIYPVLWFLGLFLYSGCSKSYPKVELVTSEGRMVVEIYETEAPVTASNFLRYVDEGRFEGATFYRVVTMQNQPNNDVKIEVIQGGLEDLLKLIIMISWNNLSQLELKLVQKLAL